MKATLDCLHCMTGQALRAARIATDDVAKQREIINRVMALIPDMDADVSPAILSIPIYEITNDVSGKPDPYRELKKAQNDFALSMEGELRSFLDEADDKLDTALHLSAAGNVIDLGVQHSDNIDVHAAIDEALHQRFGADHSAYLKESLKECKDLLFLLDNAGEIVFDKLLIEELTKHTRVTAVVKKDPILNDVILEDAEYVGLTDICEVIDNGGAFIGSPLELVPDSFLKRMEQADIILGKGQGNYETIDDFPGNVFLLLKAKCEVIAKHMGVEKGQVALISTKARAQNR